MARPKRQAAKRPAGFYKTPSLTPSASASRSRRTASSTAGAGSRSRKSVSFKVPSASPTPDDTGYGDERSFTVGSTASSLDSFELGTPTPSASATPTPSRSRGKSWTPGRRNPWMSFRARYAREHGNDAKYRSMNAFEKQAALMKDAAKVYKRGTASAPLPVKKRKRASSASASRKRSRPASAIGIEKEEPDDTVGSLEEFVEKDTPSTKSSTYRLSKKEKAKLAAKKPPIKRKVNPWMRHLKAYRMAHIREAKYQKMEPFDRNKAIVRDAAKEYKRKEQALGATPARGRGSKTRPKTPSRGKASRRGKLTA